MTKQVRVNCIAVIYNNIKDANKDMDRLKETLSWFTIDYAHRTLTDYSMRHGGYHTKYYYVPADDSVDYLMGRQLQGLRFLEGDYSSDVINYALSRVRGEGYMETIRE